MHKLLQSFLSTKYLGNGYPQNLIGLKNQGKSLYNDSLLGSFFPKIHLVSGKYNLCKLLKNLLPSELNPREILKIRNP